MSVICRPVIVCAYCAQVACDVAAHRIAWPFYVCCSAGFGGLAMREVTGGRHMGYLNGSPSLRRAADGVRECGPWVGADGELVP